MAEVINNFIGLDANSWLGILVAAIIHCVLLIHVIAVGALVFIWMERKISGRIQDRLGPTRVGGKFGWLQGLADGLKLISKEDITPGSADPFLFKIAPYLSFTASFTALLALPFAAGWAAREINTAVFFVLAILGLEVFGVILAGYASGSKWSLFGGMREAAQVVSYEVPLGMCVIIPVMIAGTMNLVTIGNLQAGWFTNWLFLHDPGTIIVFFVFFTCGLASVNRAPFDLAEAESELVAGFHTEYSGIRWSIFFMAEYGSMFIVSALGAILFFGGWNGPIPVTSIVADLTGFATWEPSWWTWAGAYLANLVGCVNFILKGVVGVIVMIWIRWTLPRLRIDQVITMCWKYCVPLAAVCFLITLGWVYNDLPTINRLNPDARESWVTAAAETGDTVQSADEGTEDSKEKESDAADAKSENETAKAGKLESEVEASTQEVALVGGKE